MPVRISPSGECCRSVRSRVSSASAEYPVSPIAMVGVGVQHFLDTRQDIDEDDIARSEDQDHRPVRERADASALAAWLGT